MGENTNSGPCVLCGAANYLPSLGGPEICPSCDCGNFGFAAVQRQRATIEDLSRKLEASRGRVAELEDQLASEKKCHRLANTMRFQQEDRDRARIAELEAQVAELTLEADRHVEEITHLRNEGKQDA